MFNDDHFIARSNATMSVDLTVEFNNVVISKCKARGGTDVRPISIDDDVSIDFD